jgi:hypothetical protein
MPLAAPETAYDLPLYAGTKVHDRRIEVAKPTTRFPAGTSSPGRPQPSSGSFAGLLR